MRLSSRASVLLLLVAALSMPSLASASEWEIDGAHTNASFKVRHMMVSWVRGEFGKVAGSIVYDEGKPESIKASITIDVASIDTRNEKRDEHLRSADFFDVATFPAITFKSTGVANVTGGGFDLVGDLTIRGVTKPVTLAVEGPSPTMVDPWGNTKIGASATLTVDRQDFGVTWNNTLDGGGVIVGDEVTILIDVEAAMKAPAPVEEAPKKPAGKKSHK